MTKTETQTTTRKFSMTRRSFFTVSFTHIDGSSHVARIFTTKQAALKWQRFLDGKNYVTQTFVTQG